MELKKVIRMPRGITLKEWMSFWITGTLCNKSTTWEGTSHMPFAGIQINLKEQTLCSPNFFLLKLAVTATKKGSVGQDHHLWLVQVYTESLVCYWGALYGTLVWLTWLLGTECPLLPLLSTPTLHSIKSRTTSFVFTGSSFLFLVFLLTISRMPKEKRLLIITCRDYQKLRVRIWKKINSCLNDFGKVVHPL